VAIGNDRQYRDFCRLLGDDSLADDPRFQTNAGRSDHRVELVERLRTLVAPWSSDELLAAMEAAKLPAGRINDLATLFSDPQVEARGLVREFVREDGGTSRVIGYPHRFSRTPPSYRKPPPVIGEDTDRVLMAELGLEDKGLEILRDAGVIASGRKKCGEEA
jgi:crotonobetainyl-CoA:carnitine CoA-transferase CaiB-like acyl-CoA transferase